MATKTLAEVTAAAQALSDKIAAEGINVTDRPTIVAAAKNLQSLLDDVQPHINDAHLAFGNQADAKTRVTNLRNQLAKIISVYSS